MGKASISIAVTGSYNGDALERAEKRLDSLSKKAAASSKGISANMEKAGASCAKAGGEIYNTGAKIESTGEKMLGVTAVLGAGGAASFQLAADFESSMSRVAGALDDPSANIEELRQLALKTGEDTIFSATEAGAAMEELAKGGLTAADIQGGALATTMDLAAAGGLDLATSANTVVQAMGAFGLTADQTSEAANALAGAAAASSADVSDLTQGLSQVSAQANSAGWSIQDTTAVLAGFADAGIKGSDAGTSLKTMLQRLAAPTDKAAAMIEELGINVRDQNGNMLDAASVAGILQDKLGGLSSAQKDAAMQTIFGSDASRAALVMTNLGREGIEKYTAATNDQSAAQRMADSQMGDSQAAIEEMNGAVETAAINIGGALAPMVRDAAGAVGDAASAFSGLDAETQQMAVGLGVAAAAAGPFLTVTGKIVQGAGNLVTGVGKAVQEVGVYADALTTTDAAALKTYSSNDKLARALKSNGAVKAAGDVNTYVQAVQTANRDTSAYERAVKKLSNEQKKGSKANEELVANLKAEVVEKRNAMNSSTGIVYGYRQEATAATASTAATKAHARGLAAMTTAANVAKVALATIAPIAIITGITMLAQAFLGAKEHADDLSAATDGLTAATSGATTEVKEEAGVLDMLSGSASGAKVDIDGMLQSQAQLAQTITETNTSAAAQSAQLQSAYATIQQYANHSDLSTDAQNRLKAAVETVNQMCGTQISVTDAANGKLADENGALSDVTGTMSGYIEKKLEQIRVDAQQQNLSALYQQQATDIETLTKAQQAYNDKQAERDEYIKNYIATCGPYVTNAEEMAQAAWEGTLANSEEAKAVKEAQSALDAVNTSIDNVSSSLTASAAATDGAALSISNLAMSSPVVSSAINAVGGDINDFSNDLADAGISVEQFRGLNESQLTQLVASWQGQTGNIVSALDGMGVEMQDKGVNAANALATGLSTGRLSVDASTAALKAAASGDWSGVVSTMRDNGVNIPDAVANGITANGYKPSAATSSMLSAVALKLTGGDVKAAAELLGSDIDSGLANGIMNGTLSEEQAAMLGEDVINKAKDSLQSHSPSQAFYQIGSDVDAGLSQGISGNTTGPLDAIGQLGQSLIDAVSGLPTDMQTTGSNSSGGLASGLASGLGSVLGSATSLFNGAVSGTSGTPGSLSATGRSAGSGFSSGLGSFAGAARGSGSSLSSSAQGGVSGSVSALSGTGRNAGSGYASGVGAASGSARGSGSRLASSASSGASGWSAYSSGSHLGNQFASGIGSAWSAVKNFASSLVRAAKSVMGFSVPEEGPWSGAEKGGVTSGLHLGQNFARGMSMAGADVRDAALRLAKDADIDATGTYRARVAGGGKAAAGTTVVNNYYTMGDVLVSASDFDEYMTMEQFFRFMRRAKAGK